MKAVWMDDGQPLTHERVQAEGIYYRKVGTDPEVYFALLRELEYPKYHESLLEPSVADFDERVNKVIREHCHERPEVRLTLEGEGRFEVRSTDDRMMGLTVAPGDFIIIPAGRYHRFCLTDSQFIRHLMISKTRGEDGSVVPIYRDDTDAEQATTYERYVKYRQLLLLLPREAERLTPDQLLFYVSHACTALWLEALWDDVSRASALLEQDMVLPAVDLFERAALIVKMLYGELALIERVSAHAYSAIRHGVAVGAGGDAPGFKRLLQIGALVHPKLAALLARRQVTMTEVLGAPKLQYDLHMLVQALLELDENIQLWRFAHFLSVERHIGVGAVSLKGRPISELIASACTKQLPELWSAVSDYAVAMKAEADAKGTN